MNDPNIVIINSRYSERHAYFNSKHNKYMLREPWMFHSTTTNLSFASW